jgi:acetoacetyl-CoA synthetase
MATTNGTPNLSKQKLWTHPDPQSSRMAGFMQDISRKYNVKLEGYEELYQWSINNIAEFWAEVWEFTGIVSSKNFDEVCSFSSGFGI